MESEPFPIKSGVRQGDPISPKLFTAAIKDIFRKAELTDGIDMDGETMTDLRFADDVALLRKTPQQMESQLNTLNNISKTVGLKMHKGKTKFMINYPNQDSLCIENEEIEKVEHYKYLGQTRTLERPQKRKSNVGSGQAGVVLEETERFFSTRNYQCLSEDKSSTNVFSQV